MLESLNNLLSPWLHANTILGHHQRKHHQSYELAGVGLEEGGRGGGGGGGGGGAGKVHVSRVRAVGAYFNN